MKKNLFLTLLCIAALQLAAAPVDVNSALAKAQSFARTLSADGRLKAPARPGTISLIHTEPSTAHPGQALYYIFNTADSYYILSGDDRAEEVLAYGDEPLDMNNIPESMQYWLGCYQQELEYLVAHPELTVETTTTRRAPARSISDVEPLLTALWDQSAPYYNQCPTSNGYYCLTGCAATSLSMICYYWKYPTEITTPIPGYTTSTLHMSLNALEPTTFDYDHMLDRYRGSYNNTQAQAVAHLMRYVGQAEHMDYTPSASGVSSWDIDRAVKVLGFDSDARMVFKDNYSDEQWAAMIQEELASGRPLEYCGFGGMSGHAFNVDGYDAARDMYHINWGWSGSGNGHCALNAFKGGGTNYRNGQLMFIGLEPPATVPTIKAQSTLTINGYAERSTTGSFTVKGALLTDGVTLELNDETGAFTLSTKQISLNELLNGKKVNVVYHPELVGSHVASIKLSSPGAKDVIIAITGNAKLETYDPVMIAARNVKTGSFVAQWLDNTPEHNVSDYRMAVAAIPFSEERFHDTFENNTATGSSTTDCSSHLDELTQVPGWTGSKVYRGDGYLRIGNANSKGWLETPGIDMRGNNGKVTVVVTAKTAGNDSSTPLNISCGNQDTTVLVTNENGEVKALLDCPDNKAITVRLSGKRVLVHHVVIMAGDDFSPAGWDSAQLIEGITEKTCQMSNLTPSTYAMRVQTTYSDGTKSQWSNEVRVVLNWTQGDVNRDGEINIADANAVIDQVLADDMGRIDMYDINGDGEITIADVNAIIDLILGGQ